MGYHRHGARRGGTSSNRKSRNGIVQRIERLTPQLKQALADRRLEDGIALLEASRDLLELRAD